MNVLEKELENISVRLCLNIGPNVRYIVLKSVVNVLLQSWYWIRKRAYVNLY